MESCVSKGDIIYVVRAPLTISDKEKMASVGCNFITFRHYGIALGDDTVIHFVGSSGFFSGDVRIRHTPTSDFAKGKSIEVDTYAMNENVFLPDEIVKRAKSMIGSNWGGYNLIRNNCEHFAYWAATDKKISRQALLVSNNSEQDIVENALDSASATVDKVFDPLIEFGDKIDSTMGWGDHKYSGNSIGDKVKRFIKYGNF